MIQYNQIHTQAFSSQDELVGTTVIFVRYRACKQIGKVNASGLCNSLWNEVSLPQFPFGSEITGAPRLGSQSKCLNFLST